jgi:hypothetical protein
MLNPKFKIRNPKRNSKFEKRENMFGIYDLEFRILFRI